MKIILLPLSDEDLLAECEISTYRASGAGGQHVNRTDSAVRLKHVPTGLIVTAQEERSQWQNKRICLEKLRLKVSKLNYRPPKRVVTRKPKAVKEKILHSKALRSKTKKLRDKRHETIF